MSKPTAPFFTVSFKGLQFAPNRLPALLTFIIVFILIASGCWQLYQAHRIVRIQQQIEAAKKAAPLLLNKHLNLTPAQLDRRRVEVTGRFDNRHQFLQDNKYYQHQLGYYVFVPFILENSRKAVLINRGWVPQGAQASAKRVSINNDNRKTTLRGTVTIPVVTFAVGYGAMGNTWPRHVLQVDSLQMSQAVGYTILPIVVLLEPDQKFGFTREWIQNIPSPAKHYANAFQLLAIATILLLAFVAMNTRKISA